MPGRIYTQTWLLADLWTHLHRTCLTKWSGTKDQKESRSKENDGHVRNLWVSFQQFMSWRLSTLVLWSRTMVWNTQQLHLWRAQMNKMTSVWFRCHLMKQAVLCPLNHLLRLNSFSLFKPFSLLTEKLHFVSKILKLVWWSESALSVTNQQNAFSQHCVSCFCIRSSFLYPS